MVILSSANLLRTPNYWQIIEKNILIMEIKEHIISEMKGKFSRMNILLSIEPSSYRGMEPTTALTNSFFPRKCPSHSLASPYNRNITQFLCSLTPCHANTLPLHQPILPITDQAHNWLGILVY
jgi:hypothetical protein